ncbi:hypothetical protein HYS49_01440 [Candidatus Woesearchaeota archaeon]|nr:hypothetical protein [Candidatus Woesearchaeota archaeon]
MSRESGDHLSKYLLCLNKEEERVQADGFLGAPQKVYDWTGFSGAPLEEILAVHVVDEKSLRGKRAALYDATLSLLSEGSSSERLKAVLAIHNYLDKHFDYLNEHFTSDDDNEARLGKQTFPQFAEKIRACAHLLSESCRGCTKFSFGLEGWLRSNDDRMKVIKLIADVGPIEEKKLFSKLLDIKPNRSDKYWGHILDEAENDHHVLESDYHKVCKIENHVCPWGSSECWEIYYQLRLSTFEKIAQRPLSVLAGIKIKN